jgi:cardiolipin synthase
MRTAAAIICAACCASATARERVYLTTPYFVPDDAVLTALTTAAMRGVDVRVLVPRRSDSLIVTAAARSYYDTLLAAGVRVYEYQPRTLHTKALLVDDDWSTIGTANFDYRNFFINYELNLVARSPRLNAALAALFEEDLHVSREIAQRPWAVRPLSGRFAELIGWSARRWL